MKIVGLDVGSTTAKAVVVEDDRVLWRRYLRHYARQAEVVYDMLGAMESECGLTPHVDRLLLTGSGATMLVPLLGGKFVQEVVSVAAAVEKFHPDARFVSEIGGEDMKSLFFTPVAGDTSRQFYMQSVCSGGTGAFIEKIAAKLCLSPEALAEMGYHGYSLHKISSKCGIFAEADANTLLKAGVPVEEVIASLFDAVVYQNIAILTKGNTPLPEVLLLGGPNRFFRGLQEAWQHHLTTLWEQRRVSLPEGRTSQSLVYVPDDSLYYACLGCVEVGWGAADATYRGADRLRWWIDEGHHSHKKGVRGLVRDREELDSFLQRYGTQGKAASMASSSHPPNRGGVILGCDFGSTTAKAVVLSLDKEVLFSCYALSRGNPIEDAKALFAKVPEEYRQVRALGITGYGKDLLAEVLGTDVAIVETVAHAASAVHFFPDVDVVCDVGGCDIKIMLLKDGRVSDFRLNSQCSSGNGAFLQGVAERYGVPLERYAEMAFQAKTMPCLSMGCGVFLQSDIVNQQRKGWAVEEIMAALAAVLPFNVWVYAGQLQNLCSVGKRFVLQGGTHKNLAVVKAQVDFIKSKVPDADIVVHPHCGEAGAVGVALAAAELLLQGKESRFHGFEAVEALTHQSTTSELTTCQWCPCHCRRTFVDVRLPRSPGRPWSRIPLPEGWERIISGNSCPRGLVEDATEVRLTGKYLDEVRRACPNVAEVVRQKAFR